MQPKNKRKRILRTNASVSGPLKVRNLKTGELAIYTPDKLQPTIPAGWVPLNSNRQQSRTPSRNFRRNSGLVVQTCGNQYRILNSSRQVVARGRLNASKETYAVTTVSYTNPNGPARDKFAHSAEEAYRMVEDYFRDVRESGLIDDEILNIRLRELAAESAANPNEYGVGEDSESPTGYDVFVQRVGDPLDSSRLNANLDEDYDSMMGDMGPVDDADLDSSRGRQSMNCGADYDPRWNEWYDFLTPEEMETYAVEQGADPGFIAEEGEEVRRAIGEGVAGYLVAKPGLNNPAETDLIVTESGMVGNYTHEDPRNRRGLRFFPYDVDEILDMSGVDEDF